MSLTKITVTIFITTVLFTAESFSQNLYSIEGKITDAKTNELLVYVNVYLSQTSIGTSTNEKGIYRIEKIPRGKYNVVASIVGYESKIVDVDLRKDNNIVIDFSLERKLYQFNQIEISDKKPTRWKEQLEFFKSNFLGDNKFAKDCVIKNEYKLEFQESELEVSASINEPLKIVNNALGYKINCFLKSFVFKKTAQRMSFEIYPVFTEIIPTTQDSLENFIINRTEAYLGSLAHLLSSLCTDNSKFREEGFKLMVAGRFWRVRGANEIVIYDSLTNRFYLKFPDRMGIVYSQISGISYSSILNLDRGIVEIDPTGKFINPNEYSLSGAMAKEGIATMLPRFWKLSE